MAEVTEQQVAQYLSRIGYQGPRAVTVETLCELQSCHMLSVPFENLSVIQKEKIHLDWQWLFDKVMNRRRGGCCFELNGLFSFLLRYLGFRVDLVAARAYSATEELSPEMTHMTLIVDLGEDKWLADVGFGDSFVVPLRFVQDEEQETKSGIHRIRKEGEKYVYEAKAKINLSSHATQKSLDDDPNYNCLFHDKDSGWKKCYIFDLIPRSIEDFRDALHFVETSPESPFTRTRDLHGRSARGKGHSGAPETRNVGVSRKRHSQEGNEATRGRKRSAQNTRRTVWD